jgi:DNA modification methylase
MPNLPRLSSGQESIDYRRARLSLEVQDLPDEKAGGGVCEGEGSIMKMNDCKLELNLQFQDSKDKEDYLTIIPISVIDISAQGKREKQDHNSVSSRAGYSPFPEEVATLCAEFFLRDSQVVFDPFAGWGERGHAIELQKKKYIGYDISSVAIKNAYEKYGVVNTLADSLIEQLPEFDGLITCPPYWNLEKYNHEDGIDRCETWVEFVDCLRNVFERCYMKAKPGAKFCIMVGDWRKNHIYYDLEFEVSSMFKEFGAKIVDKVVVSRSKISKIKIMLPQAKRLGYSVRVHENLLVFQKPWG